MIRPSHPGPAGSRRSPRRTSATARAVHGHDDHPRVGPHGQGSQSRVDPGEGTSARRVLKSLPHADRHAHGRRNDGHHAPPRPPRPGPRTRGRPGAHRPAPGQAWKRPPGAHRPHRRRPSPPAARGHARAVRQGRPHATHSHGAKVSTSVRCVAASTMRTRPISGSPKPTSTLMASVAMAVPAWPTTGPSTPTSGEAGVAPGGGWTGCKLRNVKAGTGAGAADQKTLTW